MYFLKQRLTPTNSNIFNRNICAI